MKILDFLAPEAVKAPLQSTDKQGAIFELVDVLSSAGLIRDPEALKAVVWEREQQRTTGIGEGLAIPHGKSNCSDQLVMAAGRPKEPIDFQSVDKKPVGLVILLASPPDKTAQHIQALGTISRLWISDPTFREATFGAESDDELYKLFEKAGA
jgi:mannitol/fructose-specific phosphotransferase system IIA component (Ntr-type)